MPTVSPRAARIRTRDPSNTDDLPVTRSVARTRAAPGRTSRSALAVQPGSAAKATALAMQQLTHRDRCMTLVFQPRDDLRQCVQRPVLTLVQKRDIAPF